MLKGVTASTGVTVRENCRHACAPSLFCMTAEQRRVRRREFHVSATDPWRKLRGTCDRSDLAFPELDDDDGNHTQSLSSSTKWLQMTAVV